METYIKSSMVPRSLCWEVCPQKGESDLVSWAKYFNDSGVAFLRFLAERKSEKLARLDTEIKTVKELLVPFKSGEEYRECSSNLLKTLEKDQKVKKNFFFNRDTEDYQSGLVFMWQK